MKNLQEAKIYVGTYEKYNNGSLFGKWLELSDYTDKEDFLTACKDLHKDEQNSEFMFQDWEEIPDSLIREFWISEKFFISRNFVSKLPDNEQEAFMAWCNNKAYDLDSENPKNLFNSFIDEYYGEYDCEEDFAYNLVEDCYNLPEFAKTYFDYEKFARDLFSCDFWFDSGFVFRCA
jgi:antirestriction protein